MRETLKARLSELRSKSENLVEQRGALVDGAAAAGRDWTDEDQRSFDALSEQRSAVEAQIPALEARLAELAEVEQREAAAAAARVATGTTGEQRSSSTTVRDPEVYVRGGGNGQSYFRDLANANLRGDRDAFDRLRRSSQASLEQRAMGNTNAAGGSGGEFAPPAWLVQDWVKLARPGRVTADLFNHEAVPQGESSINLPKVLTGTVVGPQTTQNTALPSTDLTTGSVGTGFITIGGYNVVSQQLLDQSAIPFDRVVLGDLAAAQGQTLGTQTLAGVGTGAAISSTAFNGLYNATVPAANQVSITGTLSAATFYSKAAGAVSAFVTNRLTQPTHWLMHPRRWYWLMAQTDSNGRPLALPDGPTYNPQATDVVGGGSAGRVGTFQGIPVIIDPLHPTNLGTGTNQDRVWLIKADDLWLYESPVQAESFREPYANSLGVMFRLYNYAGAILSRYPASIAYLDGAALATPTF